MYKRYVKRALDFISSLVLLISLSWLFVFVCIWLSLSNKGAGVFFLQERPGKGGKVFRIIKFKSMTDERDENGNLLPNKLRITKAGSFIRKTSIDELPQLLNVLKGDMSLIGPRPLKISYLDLYSKEQARRHELRPGITGWAQVNGRNSISWTEKFKLDVWYVDHCSFLLDIRIIVLSIINVLTEKNIDSGAHQIGGIPFNGHN